MVNEWGTCLADRVWCTQVKILRLLRMLGKGDADTSEAMNDILAQVCLLLSFILLMLCLLCCSFGPVFFLMETIYLIFLALVYLHGGFVDALL